MDSNFSDYLTDEDVISIKEQLEEQHFTAGKDDYDIFLASSVWDDLRNMLNERIDELQRKLENLNNTRILDVVYKARLHELRQLLVYPEGALEQLKLLEELKNEPER